MKTLSDPPRFISWLPFHISEGREVEHVQTIPDLYFASIDLSVTNHLRDSGIITLPIERDASQSTDEYIVLSICSKNLEFKQPLHMCMKLGLLKEQAYECIVIDLEYVRVLTMNDARDLGGSQCCVFMRVLHSRSLSNT